MPGRRSEKLLLHGRLTTFRRRCGKAGCRCVTGDRHESPALRYTVDGRSKLLMLTEADVAEVAAALDRYDEARAALDAAAQEGLAALAARVAARRAGERA